MFSIRRETDYAIKLLKALNKSKGDTVLSLNEVSKNTKISFLFLQKIARKLRLAGIIEAHQGVEGGYRLKMDSKKITLKKIIEATEGKCCILACCNEEKNTKCCAEDTNSAQQKKLKIINKKIIKILEQTKLSQI
ncbi:MAG: Rrf2 family transcriptional regulator [Candidatus Magasanikbacteria bacterium]|nr:Rrf2 family transcriptional regulator [Candidatus Magasanikbacteria bacterium]